MRKSWVGMSRIFCEYGGNAQSFEKWISSELLKLMVAYAMTSPNGVLSKRACCCMR